MLMNNNWPSANDWLTSQRGERGLSPPCQPLNVLLEAGRKYQVIETNTLPFFYHFCMVNNLYLQHRHISKCLTKWWSLSLLAQYFYKRSRSRFRLKRCWSCISTFSSNFFKYKKAHNVHDKDVHHQNSITKHHTR